MTALILNPAAKKKKKFFPVLFLSPIVPQNCTKLTRGKPTYQIFDSCTLLALLGISPLSLCSLCHYGLLSVYSRLWEAVKTWMFTLNIHWTGQLERIVWWWVAGRRKLCRNSCSCTQLLISFCVGLFFVSFFSVFSRPEVRIQYCRL